MNKKQEIKNNFRSVLAASDCPLMFYVDAENKNIHCSGNYICFINWIKKVAKNKALKDEIFCHEALDRDDKDNFCEIFSDASDRVHFTGGRLEDLFMPKKELTTYLKAYNDFKNSKILKQLKTNFSFKNKPRRIMSEHEGDWDYDKRHDILSFNHKKLSLVRHRKIDIDMKISFNAGFSSSNIDAYGAYGAVLVRLLEDCGLLVRLTVSTSSQNTYKNDLGDTSSFLVKNYNEYMSPQFLLRACSSNFFRRACFLKKVLGAASEGTHVESGLGQSRTFDNFFRFDDGKIFIQNMVDNYNRDKLVEMVSNSLQNYFLEEDLKVG